MQKIKTVIIDDEPKAIDVIRRYCEEVALIDLVHTFRDPVKAISFVEANRTDLIFLDINMPKLSGLDFLEALGRIPKIIFTTAYSKYAIESYEYDAVDYLLKPIDFQRFIKAVTKAQRALAQQIPDTEPDLPSNSEKIIYIKSGPQLHKISLGDILYLEKEGNYLTFQTHEKKIVSRQNMKDVFEILDPESFVRVHKSYVIALRYVEVIESHQLKVGGVTIPLGRSYRGDFFKLIETR